LAPCLWAGLLSLEVASWCVVLGWVVHAGLVAVKVEKGWMCCGVEMEAVCSAQLGIYDNSYTCKRLPRVMYPDNGVTGWLTVRPGNMCDHAHDVLQAGLAAWPWFTDASLWLGCWASSRSGSMVG